MALTVTILDRFVVAAEAEADLALVTADVQFDNSYPTGGEPLTASDLGIASVRQLDARQKGVGNRICEYDYANSKLKLYTALGTEAANGSDQSAITVRVFAIGRYAGA